MAVSAVFFDGESARDYAVTVVSNDTNLVFSGTGVAETTWSIKGLHPIDPPAPDQPFRITHDSKPGARLIVRDQTFIENLVSRNSHLKGGYSWRHLGHVVGWTVAGFAGLAALGYVTLTVLPHHVAKILPDSWRNRAGEQVVKALVETSKRCETTESKQAVSAMIAALAESGIDLPPANVEIYDMNMVNAFAAPGGRIVLTRGLIATADTPEEVTGVLAHELGHVYHLHSEAQMVRLSGLQILLSVFSGSSSDLWSNAAGLAALLRYSRDAEREADTYAREVMQNASVNPVGLRSFFEKVLKMEGGAPKSQENSNPSALDRIGNVFSTHPGTEDRIKSIQPLPAGKTPVKVMTDAQWQALRKACN
jgi:beta-barrel assembly-enhancing protease